MIDQLEVYIKEGLVEHDVQPVIYAVIVILLAISRLRLWKLLEA